MRLGVGERDEVLMLIAESEKEKQDLRRLHVAYMQPGNQITYVEVHNLRRYPKGARMSLRIDKA